MRKLTPTEENALRFVSRNGGSYCPNTDASAEPFIMDTLKALVRKKRLSDDAVDGAPPVFALTMQGRADAEGGVAS